MSDEIRAEIKAAAKALCHYPSGPSTINSCCPGIGRCEMDATIAEIACLRATIAAARQEGMEEAAKIADSCGADWTKSARGKFVETKWDYESRADAADEIAAAIRAAAKEGK